MQNNTNKALLEQIGALYTRNKSLTKGHATLTRRVQELEAQLAESQQAYEKPKHINCLTHVRGITEQETVLSKAHHDLQQDVIALSHRLHALEFAQKPSSHAAAVIGPQSGLEAAENLSKTIERHIKQALVNATKIGGILNGR